MAKTLIVIVGPTASGKTSISISLAKRLACEILSCDSRQFYSEIPIGTAAPSQEEQDGIVHHFIGHTSITESISAGDFEKMSLSTLEHLFQQNDVAIMVGGSGLFVDALCKGLDDFPAIDPSIRKDLIQQFETEGIEVLQAQLKDLDPEYYQQVDLQNQQRVIRALEVCIGTGKPYFSFRNNPAKKRPFDMIKIGLNMDRTLLYERINQRVHIMMEEGLLNEAKAMLPFRAHNALQTVGYKELFAHFDGDYDLETAIAEIQKNSRRYAKRQLTWFKKDEEICWFEPNALHKVKEYLKKQGLKLQ